MGFSHVVQIGNVKLDFYPKTYTLIKEKAEKSDVRCADDLTADRMRNAIDEAAQAGDTLGGKFEVIFGNLPVGLGSYVHWDKALDGRLAQAVMSIPAVKAVEVGAGVDAASLRGSQMHDEIFVKNKITYRHTNNAGGLEGGMTNGEALVIKGTMKAIPTMRKALATVDIKDMQPASAHFERSDTCAVPACAVVAEARVAIILVVVDAVFSGEAVEIQTINQLLKEDIKNPSEALSAFCVALAKTWGILAQALQKEGEEEEKMEILHVALTRVLEALTGLYIPQRRAVLEQLAKLCNSRVSDYLFISPEESKEIDLRIHNAASIGGNQILEGRTFAVVNRSSYQTVKYAEIEVC